MFNGKSKRFNEKPGSSRCIKIDEFCIDNDEFVLKMQVVRATEGGVEIVAGEEVSRPS